MRHNSIPIIRNSLLQVLVTSAFIEFDFAHAVLSSLCHAVYHQQMSDKVNDANYVLC